jgi:hypothetical protein
MLQHNLSNLILWGQFFDVFAALQKKFFSLFESGKRKMQLPEQDKNMNYFATAS